MAATIPHNNTGVMVTKLLFDMSHLPVCAGSMPKFRPSSYFAGKLRRFCMLAACQHLGAHDVIAITKESIVIAGTIRGDAA
jgi:hypothetical protein